MAHARLSPSSNISYPTTTSDADPRRRQQDEDDDDNDEDDDNDQQHDVPGQRISSPDYVDVEIPQSIGVGVAAPGQQSPVSTSSEGYPSWLPKRPPPPAPGSTLHSLSTAMMFDSGGPAEYHPGAGTGAGAAAAGAAGAGGPAGASSDDRQPPQTPMVPFSGGRKPTPRSVRIVSMQDSNAASATTPTGAGSGGRTGAGGRREPGTDRTTTTRVSSSAGALPPPRPSSSSFPFSSSFFSRSRVLWSRAAKVSAIGALSPTLFSSSQTPDARLRAAIAAPPKFRSPGLHLELLRDPSWRTRLHFYLFPVLVLAHVPLQTFLDFNTIYILIE